MTKIVAVILLAGALMGVDSAKAANECGIGCRATASGACVVDGWGTGAPVWNECPAGTRPRPPCGEGYFWSKRHRACFLKTD